MGNDMDNARTIGAPSKRGMYLNMALTANALLLGLLVVGGPRAGESSPLESAANAAQPADERSGLVSAAEQRKEMISELKNLSARVASMEKAIKGPIAVKVVEMPKDTSKDNAKASK